MQSKKNVPVIIFFVTFVHKNVIYSNKEGNKWTK